MIYPFKNVKSTGVYPLKNVKSMVIYPLKNIKIITPKAVPLSWISYMRMMEKFSDTNCGTGDGFYTYPLYAIGFMENDEGSGVIERVDISSLKVPE